MTDVALIFPHQLFRKHPAVAAGRPVYLVEEWLFFRQYSFHKQKLVLHRASMRWYADWLRKQGYDVQYIESQAGTSDCRQLVRDLAQAKVTDIHIADPADNWLLKRM